MSEENVPGSPAPELDPAPTPGETAPAPAASEAFLMPQKRRLPWRWIIAAAAVLVLALGGLGVWQFCQGWCEKGRLEPQGGFYFIRRVELPVPSFRQADPRWHEDQLGPS